MSEEKKERMWLKIVLFNLGLIALSAVVITVTLHFRPPPRQDIHCNQRK